jgi:hypothetical protein
MWLWISGFHTVKNRNKNHTNQIKRIRVEISHGNIFFEVLAKNIVLQ